MQSYRLLLENHHCTFILRFHFDLFRGNAVWQEAAQPCLVDGIWKADYSYCSIERGRLLVALRIVSPTEFWLSEKFSLDIRG